jgi:cysteine desulfurase family protein
MIYLDNSATTLIKPKEVYKKIISVMKDAGGNAGRGGHIMADRAATEIFNTRIKVADFFSIKDPQRVCFTCNATSALNYAIKGVLKKGDHVIISSFEHNSVYRPVHKLLAEGIDYSVLECDCYGNFDNLDLYVKDNTKMIVTNHISNVCGNIADIEKIGLWAKNKGILFMVDASQSAGHCKIDVEKQNIDILALSGHKGLFGMQGTGVLYIKDGIETNTIVEGGTGSMSTMKNQPDIFPDRFEAGTLSAPAIASLGVGIDYINRVGIANIEKYIAEMDAYIKERLLSVKNVSVYGINDFHSGVIAFNIGKTDSEIIANLLSEKYKVMVRGGLHCSYLAHKTLGTLEQGCVRASLSCFNTFKECENFINTVDRLAREVV